MHVLVFLAFEYCYRFMPQRLRRLHFVDKHVQRLVYVKHTRQEFMHTFSKKKQEGRNPYSTTVCHCMQALHLVRCCSEHSFRFSVVWLFQVQQIHSADDEIISGPQCMQNLAESCLQESHALKVLILEL